MFKNIKINKARKILKKRIIIMLDKGTEKEEIIKRAEKVGWKKEILDEIFDEIEEKKKDKIELKIPIKKKKPEETLEEELKRKEQELLGESKEEKPKKGLVSQIQELNEKIDIMSDKKKQEKKLKKKKFKIPFKVKSQLKKLAVKNKVQVMLLQRTRNIKPIIGEIRDGMLLIKDQVYNGAVNSTWLWNGKYPTHIVPEWDLQPLTPEGIEKMKSTITMSPSELYKDCIINKRSAEPQKIIIRAIEAKQNLMLKGKANVKVIILTILGTLVAAAVLFGGNIV